MSYSLLLFCLLSLFSCKKDSSFDNIPDTAIKDEGVLRVECSDCKINYVVENKTFNTSIKDGSNDIPFFYVAAFNLKTKLVSNVAQNIRLMILDSNGSIVSNELISCKKGEVVENTFAVGSK